MVLENSPQEIIEVANLACSGGTIANSSSGHCNSRFKWNYGVKLMGIYPWI